MLRNIFTVNATHVVVSESHPEGVLSNVTGFPVSVDSRSYGATEANPNGDEARALDVAKAEIVDMPLLPPVLNTTRQAGFSRLILK